MTSQGGQGAAGKCNFNFCAAAVVAAATVAMVHGEQLSMSRVLWSEKRTKGGVKTRISHETFSGASTRLTLTVCRCCVSHFFAVHFITFIV